MRKYKVSATGRKTTRLYGSGKFGVLEPFSRREKQSPGERVGLELYLLRTKSLGSNLLKRLVDQIFLRG